MASNNMFLGYARGSVGDVTFYRSGGVQRSRARNRRPANPRTDKQLVQRAVMASVSRLYSVGRAIFDHSWQGEQVGFGSQRGFLRDNAPLLRSLVVAALNDSLDPDETPARLSAPGISVAVPFNGLKISNGSYQQQFFARNTSSGLTYYKAPAAAEGATIAEYAAANGLIPGDIYTFVGIGAGIMSDANIVYDATTGSGDAYPDYHKVWLSRLSYCQLLVRADIAQQSAAVSAATLLSDLFVLYDGNADLSNTLLTSEIALTDLDDSYPAGVLGVIRSREDSGLRSTSYAYFSGSADYGLTPDVLLDAWRRDSQPLAGSELILEGENFT